MEFLTSLAGLILGTYLSFVGALSEQVAVFLPQTENIEDRQIVDIESHSRFNPIPDILIQNSEYQRAAVVEGIDPKDAPATALEAVVNIFCEYHTDSYVKTTTGTGFIIDTDGIILTNAHVAQFLLLEGLYGDAECIIRAGNPAIPMYEAELLYIPPAWIRDHAHLINAQTPRGTGERDYALLYISNGLDSKPMPATFPALPFKEDLLKTDILETEVFATGYPAETALSEGTMSALSPRQATTTVAELMTFGSQYIDLFTIRGSSMGEHGSSGGPVVDADGRAIGIISTKGDDTSFGPGSLRALSLPYINRTIEEETGFSLRKNLSGNLPYRAQLFKETLVPFLQNMLQQEL